MIILNGAFNFEEVYGSVVKILLSKYELIQKMNSRLTGIHARGKELLVSIIEIMLSF